MTDRQPSFRELMEIFSIAFVSFIGILMTTAVNVNFPMLVRYFHTSLANVQWFSTGAMIISAVSMICSAYLDRRFNDRTVFLAATVVLLISLVICTFSTNYDTFLFGRLLDGFSIGSCTPLMFNVIPRLVPKSRIGFYMASGEMVVATGPSLGPTYGGAVNYYLNWKMIFVIMIPVVLVLMILGLVTITNHVPFSRRSRFDTLGFIVVAIALFALEIGLNSLNRVSLVTLVAFAIGIGALVLFLKHGSHDQQAILNTRVLRYRQFTWDILAYFLIQSTNISLSGLLIPNFSQIAMGVTAVVSGLILLPGNLFRIVCMPFGGAFLDKYGAKLPIGIGLGLMAIYFATMALIVRKMGTSVMLVTYLLYNLGLAMSFSNVLTSGLNSLPAKLRNDGNAIFNAVQIYGGAVGTCLLSLIISLVNRHSTGESQIKAMKNGGQWCFGFLLVIIVIAFLAVWKGFTQKEHKI